MSTLSGLHPYTSLFPLYTSVLVCGGFGAQTWDEYFVIAVLSAVALILGYCLEWRRDARDARRAERDRAMDDRAAARDDARMSAAESRLGDLDARLRTLELDAAYQRGLREGGDE